MAAPCNVARFAVHVPGTACFIFIRLNKFQKIQRHLERGAANVNSLNIMVDLPLNLQFVFQHVCCFLSVKADYLLADCIGSLHCY